MTGRKLGWRAEYILKWTGRRYQFKWAYPRCNVRGILRIWPLDYSGEVNIQFRPRRPLEGSLFLRCSLDTNSVEWRRPCLSGGGEGLACLSPADTLSSCLATAATGVSGEEHAASAPAAKKTGVNRKDTRYYVPTSTTVCTVQCHDIVFELLDKVKASFQNQGYPSALLLVNSMSIKFFPRLLTLMLLSLCCQSCNCT